MTGAAGWKMGVLIIILNRVVRFHLRKRCPLIKLFVKRAHVDVRERAL